MSCAARFAECGKCIYDDEKGEPATLSCASRRLSLACLRLKEALISKKASGGDRCDMFEPKEEL